MKAFITTLILLVALPVSAQPLVMTNAPLRDFAAWVSTKTGKSISFADSADTPINVNVPDISTVDAWSVFESTVNTSGLYLTEVDSLYVVSSRPVKATDDQKPLEPLSYPLKTRSYQVTPANLRDIHQALNALSNTWHKQEKVRLGREDVPPFTVTQSAQQSIILLTTANKFFKDADTVVRMLDKPVQQVLIEAVIFETSNLNFDAIGVDYRNIDLGTGLSIDFGNSKGPLNVVAPGVGIAYSRNGQVNALIKALDTADETKILSTPVVRIVDRQKGLINVGQEVPFITSTQTSETGQITNTIIRKTVGITLDVQPVVQSNGSIQVTLRTTAGSLTGDSTASDVITNNRVVETVINAQSGEVVYLGGLITEELKKSVVGIPGLSQLPVLGGLFAHKENRKSRTKLAIFLKSTVLKAQS